MRILHIITRLILGGAQQNTVLCCRAQVQAGHQVHLAYGPIYGPEGSLYDTAFATGAKLHEISTMRRAVLPVHDWLCYRALRKLIREIEPDIVHTHSSKAGILGRAAAWAEKVPGVVHTVHGLPFHPRNPAIVNAIYIGLERWAARRCHRIIGVTQAMCDEFLAQHIGSLQQYTVAPSGMDIGEFTPGCDPLVRKRVRAELNIPEHMPVVGIVARLDKLKGQEDLIATMPSLLASHADLRLLLVGDGWYRQALEEQVAQLQLQGKVIFTGLVKPARVPEMLSVMDVHGLPSYQEGQPRTLVQALLCACAIVGYDAGGIKDVCQHEKTGLLVPLGDRQALTQAVNRLLTDAPYRKQLAQQGQAFARTHYDHRTMIRKLEEVYQQVLTNHNDMNSPQRHRDTENKD